MTNTEIIKNYRKDLNGEVSIQGVQIRLLNENGIYPLESHPRIKQIIVKREDLQRATALRISNEITIACKC